MAAIWSSKRASARPRPGQAPDARDDVTLHQRSIADIEVSTRTALATVDPTPYFQRYGENLWAAVRATWMRWRIRPLRL
jgi:hypothetical protein